jgi:hypothetical protein
LWLNYAYNVICFCLYFAVYCSVQCWRCEKLSIFPQQWNYS